MMVWNGYESRVSWVRWGSRQIRVTRYRLKDRDAPTPIDAKPKLVQHGSRVPLAIKLFSMDAMASSRT